MANVIAVVWDFDKTLVDGYMQDPIFDAFGVEAKNFWNEVNALPSKYKSEQKIEINKDTIYLNQFIKEAQRGGKFEGLNNAQLEKFGRKLKFYPGIPEIFDDTSAMVSEDKEYASHDIKVEHYVISTGMKAVIRGSIIPQHVKSYWGCEFIERKEGDGSSVISELGYTIDNTSKTRALFEINKGIPDQPDIDVNAQMPEKFRRVRFENMIYVADGPSDIPAFSVVKHYGGSTFAVYPACDKKAFSQVEQMREDKRVDMYAEADYTEGTTSNMWLKNKIIEKADAIVVAERAMLNSSLSSVPHHLT